MGKPGPRAWQLVLAISFISIIETSLIIFWALPPIASYSPGNLLFMFARIALFIYAGILFAGEGVKKAALNGAILAFFSSLIICIASLAGKFLFDKPVLGMPAPNTESLFLILLVVILGNTVMGALISGITAFVKRLR